jgi:hypothetical protein
METALSEQEQYLLKKYDYIPISAELIDHVRRLDGFNVSSTSLINFKIGGRTRKTQSHDDSGRQKDGKLIKLNLILIGKIILFQ